MHLAPCVFVLGGRKKKEEKSFRKVWVVDGDIYAATRLGCLQTACSLSDQPPNQLGSGGCEEQGAVPRTICSSVVLKLQELACAPENKVGSPEERAVIRGQSGVPSPPCHPFYRVASGVVPSPSRPSLTRGLRH